MSDTIHCPACGLPLPPDAPQGECPRCLLRAGLESQPAIAGVAPSDAPPPPPTRTSSGHSHFVPPTVAELQQRIPQYEILELIGQGGMGAVYKARQRGLERLVAIKILPFEVSQSTAFAERFAREARALAMLSHPHIVAVHDFGQAEGMCYFVMEYVAGVNLRQAIQAGKMNPAEALAIVPQICEALQFAHDEGVVHRDIKPENILIDMRGRVKIADFGLAKLLGTATPEHSLTGTQQVMGTLRYMAPEQMFGSKEVDHRADIFSLGVVFYELLTGELPIGRFAPPSKKKASVDARLDDVVMRALENEPAERYQHVSEMKTGVDAIVRTPAAARAPQPIAIQSGEWEQLLDETDRSTRLRQHAFLLLGVVALVLAGMFLIAGPVRFMIPAVGAAALLFTVAALHNQHWELTCAGQRIVFENGVFTGSRLLLNGRLAQRGAFGYRDELAARLPDGSGRSVVAITEAGFVHFRCRLLLQPAAAGSPAEAEQPSQSSGLAGTTLHLIACVVLSLALLWFLFYFGPPLITMIDGPDTELLRTGSGLGLGRTVQSITASLVVIFCALAVGTAFAWWKYREAGKRQLHDAGMLLPVANNAEATPRLSAAALWGAILAPLFLVTLLMFVGSTLVVHRSGSGEAGPSVAIRLIAMLFLIPGVIGIFSPFATTLLGILAIAQIRNSKGKLYGLPLALFDALAYPFLLLDGALLGGGYFLLTLIFADVLQFQYNSALRNWAPPLLTVVLLLPLVIALNVWLVRLTWRAASDQLTTTPAQSPSPREPALPLSAPAEPRLSLSALWGAILSPLVLVPVLLFVATFFAVKTPQPADGPPSMQVTPVWIMFPILCAGLPGLIAPFVTTLLGVLAIGQIRRSKGKLYGMPLAVFDALLFPLLLLDVILAWLGFMLFVVVLSLVLQVGHDRSFSVMGPLLLTALLILPLVLVLDLWLVRLTWQAANQGLAEEGERKPLPQKEPPPFRPQRSDKNWYAIIIVLVVLAMVLIPTILAGGVLAAYFFSHSSPASKKPMQVMPRSGMEPDTSWQLERNTTEPAKQE